MNNNLLVYSLTVVIIVCCVLIIILAIKYKSSIEEDRDDVSTEEKPTTIGDVDSEEDECHTISRLMVYKRDNDVWICPFCETENELTRNTCCLCGKSKG